ncbi:ATP-binding protein [Micromonospora sp. NPDC049523]|uniref:ATP-binding protein n=1 Tax=Micromonospora sp. NPDC049523 TaxID=3155921 RepID=UPI003428B6CB
MQPDALLSEVERQQKYLALLPEHYAFPLFNARQAVESQRRSGYKDTAAAAREIVDNAIEAGASNIDVIFDAGRGGSGRRYVSAVAFIDNGSGMVPEMARYALSWGGGSHFDDPSFIGRFGFGLPNASINQTRRVEVYTRTAANERFTMVYLDINDLDPFGMQSVAEAREAELPGFVQRHLKKSDTSLDHGTVVVWCAPDRLTYRSPAHLKEHLLDDFGVTYRYLLHRDGHNVTDRFAAICVEGVMVEAADPLFLMPGTRLYLPPEEGGANLVEDLTIPVKYAADAGTGEFRLTRLTDQGEIDEIGDGPVISTIQVRIGRLPVGFAVGRKSRSGPTTDANRRFDIRKSHRGMSFVRAGRELQTVDVFPRSVQDVASGLGDWPLLQAYAYHWGVEVRFGPELDDVFGITNDKQGVRPIEDFWRVLAQEKVDDLVRREQAWQTKSREKKENEAVTPEDAGVPTDAEHAAEAADVALGKRPKVPERHLPAAREAAQREAEQRAGQSGAPVDEARRALDQETKRRRNRLVFVDQEHGPFYEPSWNGAQIQVNVNRRHPFYEVFYADLLKSATGKRPRAALDLLLIALARTELTVEDPDMELWFSAQRKHTWSPFLDTALRDLARRMSSGEEPDDAVDVLGGEDERPSR